MEVFLGGVPGFLSGKTEWRGRGPSFAHQWPDRGKKPIYRRLDVVCAAGVARISGDFPLFFEEFRKKGREVKKRGFDRNYDLRTNPLIYGDWFPVWLAGEWYHLQKIMLWDHSLRRFLRKPIRPASPIPNNQAAPGRGTGVVSRTLSKLIWSYQEISPMPPLVL